MGHVQSRTFSDALSAFWPGLQTFYGDVIRAAETHEFLYQVMLRNIFIPESYHHKQLSPNWSQYVLRPEFAESTWFLYTATGDSYYLNVAKNIVRALEAFTRVKCGYAAISDVKNMRQLDQMDSYYLSEMFKYLYMIFAEEEDIPIDLSDLVITTEAHFVPVQKTSPYTGKSSFVYKCQDVSINDFQASRQLVRDWMKLNGMG